jgi:hypothetical protein
MTAIERKAADKLVEAVSKPGFSLAVFGDAIKNMHPTHQQSIMRAFMAMVDALYSDYTLGYYDQRNQGTMFTAARIREALDQSPIDLPYI